MKVLLVSLNREKEPFTAAPLGLALVASALLKAGHEVRTFDLLFSEDINSDLEAAVNSFNPGLIGLSLRNIESSTEFLLPAYKETIDHLKGLTRATIAVGGPGFSIMPRQTLEFLGLELGVAGEGERSAVELADAIENGLDPADVPGVCSLREGRYRHNPANAIDDMSCIHTPAWELFPSGYDMVGVQTKRGCSFGCIYCTYPGLEGRRMRLRPPAMVADELAGIVGSGAETPFYFVDNVFNNPKDHAEGVCREIFSRGLKISWGCLANPIWLDREFVGLMAEAGCQSVEIGADSLSDRMLKKLNKSFTAMDVKEAIKTCKDAGMMSMVFVILGGPGENSDTLRETFDALEESAPDKVFAVGGIRIYPGTPLAVTAVDEGVIRPDDSLLMPSFYVSERLGDGLYSLAEEFFRAHPGWIYYPANGVGTGVSTASGREVAWNDGATMCLDTVIKSVPMLLRPIAKRAVTKKAGKLAVERRLAIITEAEVRDAFLSETPSPFQKAMIESLKRLGL
jgi:radical SAM superfamily enzyme YgiQ (UPF0313 family)